MRALLDSAFDGIVILDASGAVLDLNRAAARMLGHRRENTVGQELFSLIVPPELREEYRSGLQRHDPTNPIVGRRLELEAVKADGLRIPIELSVAQVARANGHLYSVWIRELTHPPVTEATPGQDDMQLRQSLKMEAIGRLAGGVAHDFNNVLTAIFGYADLLLDSFDANHPARNDVLEIKKAGERAATLTRQLLAFSRKQVMQTRQVNLNSVVSNLQPLLSRLIGEDIQLTIESDPSLDDIYGDPGQLDQVLMNLAANARDAMAEGGRLAIAMANETVTGERPGTLENLVPGRYVRLRVTDTGHGIPQDVLRQIFEPFFTTKEQGKGTGLGLATVYGIVKQSNGWISASSEIGQGTTFTIYLPAVVPRADATSSP